MSFLHQNYFLLCSVVLLVRQGGYAPIFSFIFIEVGPLAVFERNRLLCNLISDCNYPCFACFHFLVISHQSQQFYHLSSTPKTTMSAIWMCNKLHLTLTEFWVLTFNNCRDFFFLSWTEGFLQQKTATSEGGVKAGSWIWFSSISWRT